MDNLEKPTCGYEALIFTKNVYSHRQPNKLIKTIKNHCPDSIVRLKNVFRDSKVIPDEVPWGIPCLLEHPNGPQFQKLVTKLYFGCILVAKRLPKVTPNHQNPKKRVPKSKMFAYIVATGRDIVISVVLAHTFVFFAHVDHNCSPKNAS